MRVSWKLISITLFSLILPLQGSSLFPTTNQKNERNEKYALKAIRIDTSPQIDGILEKEIWGVAPSASHFIQKQPAEGMPATEDTEVRILYDDDNLYIGIMCYDSEPKKIIANEKRRDSENIYDNDHFQIMLDTFRDRRNGYVFVINPLAAKLDLQIRKEGQNEGGRHVANPNVNKDWDGVWEVRASLVETGWSAEIEIPLNTLRYNAQSEEGWGLNFLRNVRRKNEQSTWVPLPRNLDLYKVSMAGDLRGLEGLRKALNLQIKPYILAGNVNQRELGVLKREGLLDGGIDLKYGLSSNLTMDLTLNTDFSQVEADDQQINLTRFSLFYPEKREFFLENSAIFNIGGSDDAMIFFSRSIGISPSGEEIPLLGGAKIAGKIQRFNVGLINIQAQSKDNVPSNNFSVFRLSRDVLGKSAVGFMLTNRQPKGSGDFNRTLAFDGDFILGSNLSLNGYLAFTDSPGLKGRNRAGKLGYQWISNLLDIDGYYFDIQENFNAEMGFVKRTGIRRFQTHVGVTPEPNIPGVRRLNPHIFFLYTTDQENNLLLDERHFHLQVDLINGGNIGFQWNKEHEFVDFPFAIQKDITLPVGTYKYPWWQVNYNGNRSRNFFVIASYRGGGFYSGNSKIVNLRLGLRPLPNFNSEINFIYNNITLPQGDFRNHLLITRVNYNFTTNLALMSLVQWNSDTDEVNINLRLNFIYKPGSDLFIVYNERRQVEGLAAGILDRTIAVKLTYLFNF